MIVGKLGYNPLTKRFGVLVMDLWEKDGLHCGTCLEVYIDGEWVSDRLEMSNHKYYLVRTGLIDEALEGLKIRI